MSYIKNALIARMQNWQSKHYEKTGDGKKLRSLKDNCSGQKCFVIGNGPSLIAEDLQKLYERKIPSFGTNRVYNIFPQTDWRPTYYVSEDVNVLRNVQWEASAIQAKEKFVPVNLKWYEDIQIKGATYFYMDYTSSLDYNYGLSLDIAHGIRCRSTVTTTCIQIAVYMGFSEIYLLGVDHSFSKMVDKNGNVIIDNSIRSHFIDNYNSDIKDLGYNIDETTEAYLNIEQLSRDRGNFRVYNATRGGRLEVFERVDFDDIINIL